MAAQHDNLAPHAANADLLRSALANHHTGEKSPDHLGSISGTASGVATPRPSGTDKRLPGILHSYFGQVCVPSPATPCIPGSCDSYCSPRMEDSTDIVWTMTAGGLPTAPPSPAHEGPRGQPTGDQARPPLLDFIPDGRPASVRLQSGASIMPLRSRQNSPHGSSDPLHGVTTILPVHALHILNPNGTTAKTPPSAPTKDSSAVSALSSLSFQVKMVTLTDEYAIKATPPVTPRTLSNDGVETKKATPPPGERAASRLNSSGTSTPQTSRVGAPVPPPKGYLTVTISGARGLRPSIDPYAVCVFEWIESIAFEHKQGRRNADEQPEAREHSFGSVAVNRLGHEMGRSMAMPMKSRQSSTTSLSDQKDFNHSKEITDPQWDHQARFDVLGKNSDVDVYVYDRGNSEAFLGHVTVTPDVFYGTPQVEGWYKLAARDAKEENVSGEIHLKFAFEKTNKKKFGFEDFEFLKLVGKGTFGQVYQVRKKDTQQILALKMLSKKVIIQKKEVAHTIGERNILVRTASADSPFIVGLKYSFQTPTDLFLVTGFMSGGELFNHLQKAGRFDEPRAKFYIAELILALQHLHQHDIVYRDLKPENILLDANGHIALCDFGLSKANLAKDETTNTFCGTTEYLAPEVLLDEAGYTKMVDFWSLGVLVFEMCCGWSPFYADDTQQMYKNIAFGKVRFPKDTLSTEGRNFVKGLLNRNPKHRLGAERDAEELKEHVFFADTDWNAIMAKSVVPPFKPKLKNILDVSNFDPEFTEAYQNPMALNERAAQLAAGAITASTPLSPGMQANFKGFTFVDESHMDDHFKSSELEKMDEDVEDEEDWEHVPNRADRMSGIIKTSSNDDGIFNDAHFDM